MRDRATRLDAHVPQRYRVMFERALRGELPPRATIKAKCLECCAWQRFDGGEDRIGRCAMAACPLHAYRPFQRPQEPAQAPEGEGLAAEGATENGGRGIGAV